MAFHFVLLAALVASSTASVVPGGATIVQSPPVLAAPIARAVVAEPYDPNPHYSFGYDVQDPYTGDSHGQVETRSGDVVTGSYNLLEADGSRRVVNYQADPINGFNAVVSRQPSVAVARVASIATPAVYGAPIAPVVASAPWAAPPAAPWQGVVRSAPLW